MTNDKTRLWVAALLAIGVLSMVLLACCPVGELRRQEAAPTPIAAQPTEAPAGAVPTKAPAQATPTPAERPLFPEETPPIPGETPPAPAGGEEEVGMINVGDLPLPDSASGDLPAGTPDWVTQYATSMAQIAKQGGPGVSAVQLYASTDSEEDLRAFYKRELAAAGWQHVTDMPSGVAPWPTSMFTKDDAQTYVAIGEVGGTRVVYAYTAE